MRRPSSEERRTGRGQRGSSGEVMVTPQWCPPVAWTRGTRVKVAFGPTTALGTTPAWREHIFVEPHIRGKYKIEIKKYLKKLPKIYVFSKNIYTSFGMTPAWRGRIFVEPYIPNTGM